MTAPACPIKLAAMALMLAAACARLPAPGQAPVPAATATALSQVMLSFDRLELENESLDSSVLVLIWRLDNPTSRTVTARRWQLDLTVGEVPVPVATEGLELTAPPLGHAIAQMRAPLAYLSLWGGQWPGTRPCQVTVGPEVDGQERRIHVATTVRLVADPTVTLQTLKVKRVDDRYEAVLGFTLRNPNRFPVELENFRAEVRFAGDRFDSVGAKSVALKGGESLSFAQRVSAPISRLGGLSRAALSSTEAISTDLIGSVRLAGHDIQLEAGRMIWPQ